MKVSVENKQYILEQLELLNEDSKTCKSIHSLVAIQNQIDLFEKELQFYKKPVLIDPPYADGANYKLTYVDFTDEELNDTAGRLKYLSDLSTTISLMML